MNIGFPKLSITLLLTASLFSGLAYADQDGRQRERRGRNEVAQEAPQERVNDQRDQRYPPQYAPQYQDAAPRVAQRGERRYLPAPYPSASQGDGSYPQPPRSEPQQSVEEVQRAERDRQAERRALLRRQINEARDLYAPVPARK